MTDTAVSDIITAAYRECNIIPIGTSPATSEIAEGTDRLNRFISAVYGYEIGENLANWKVPSTQRTAPVAANFPQLPYPLSLEQNLLLPNAYDSSAAVYKYPPPNSRIVWAGKAAMTVYFPESPSDGARMSVIAGAGSDGASILTLDGNGFTIETVASQAQPAVVTPKTWFFRADIGDWQLIQDVSTDATGSLPITMPFPREFDMLWIGLLALRIAPAYNKKVPAETQTAMSEALKRIKARYRQTAPTIYGAFNAPDSLQSFRTGVWMV